MKSLVLNANVVAGLALSLVALATTPAQAAATTYFGNNSGANGGVSNGIGAGADPVNQRDLFKNSLASFLVESFEARAASPNANSDATVSNLFGLGAATTLKATDPQSSNTDLTTQIQNQTFGGTPGNPGPSFLGRFNTTGDPTSAQNGIPPVGSPANVIGGKWWETNYRTVTVHFGTAVSAFGTFLTDLGDFDGSMQVDFKSATGAVVAHVDLLSAAARQVNGGLAFFGYTNDTTSFTDVIFSFTQARADTSTWDVVGFDDLLTGTLKTPSAGAPEPSSIALSALSLGLLAFARRRKISR